MYLFSNSSRRVHLHMDSNCTDNIITSVFHFNLSIHFEKVNESTCLLYCNCNAKYFDHWLVDCHLQLDILIILAFENEMKRVV